MKRALGVAVLGGGLLAVNAAAASAQEVSADASARLGRPTSAQVRVCADGLVLPRLVGSCSGSGTTAAVRVGRDRSDSSAVRVRARAPRLAAADVAVGTGRSRPRATASGQASATPAPAAGADTDAAAALDLPRDGRLLDLDAELGLAGVGLLGTSPFTLAGDPATDTLLPTGELTLADLTGEVPAGIGVLETGPIASGNQVGVDVGDVSPSVPVAVCGNGVGVRGDASASCGANQAPASGSGSTGSTGASAGTGDSASGSLLDGLASGNQVDAGIGDVSPSIPVTVCGNGVGVLGDAAAGCGANQAPAPGGGSTTGPSGSTQAGGTLAGNQVDAQGGDVAPSAPVTVCGNGVGVLGDASASCGAGQPAGGGSGGSASGSTGGSAGTGISTSGTLLDNLAASGQVDAGISTAGAISIDPGATTSTDATADLSIDVSGGSGDGSGAGTGGGPSTDPGTGAGTDAGAGTGVDRGVGISSSGITAPPPGTSPGTTPGSTGTSGTSGTPGSTGTAGTVGLTPGTSGVPGDPVTTSAPLRPFATGSSTAGVLPFTGAASDRLALFSLGLLAAGALTVRAARPAAARKGGGDR